MTDMRALLAAYYDAYGCIDSACTASERRGVCLPTCAVSAALRTPPTDADEQAAREALQVHTAPLCLVSSNCVRPRGHDGRCSRTMRDNGDPWDHLRTALRALDASRADIARVTGERDAAYEMAAAVCDAEAEAWRKTCVEAAREGLYELALSHDVHATICTNLARRIRALSRPPESP